MEKDRPLLKILERMPVPALIASPVTSKIMWANSRLLAMYGTEDPGRVVGSSLLDFIQAPQLGRALTDLAKVVAGQSPPPVTYQLRTATGAYAAGQVSSVPMMFRGQVAMLSFVTDVTERERLLRNLSESEERYRLLLDSMPSGVVVLVEGAIVYANSALSKALGVASPEDLVGRQMEKYIAEQHRRDFERTRQEVLLRKKSGTAAPIALVRADGSEFTTTTISTVIHWHGSLATQTLIHGIGLT